MEMTKWRVVFEHNNKRYEFIEQRKKTKNLKLGSWSDENSIRFCDCERSAKIREKCDRDFGFLDCGHTVKLVCEEKLPNDMKLLWEI